MLFINGAEGNVAPLYSVGSDINSPALKKYDTLLGDRILAANASIAQTTADVSLALGTCRLLPTRLRPISRPA